MTTASHVPTSSQIAVESFQLGGMAPTTGMAVVYNGRCEIKRTGEDFAAVQIRVGIDEWFDEVSVDAHQCGDLEVLDRALSSLSRVRDALADLYEGRERRAGRCMAADENGRCTSDSNHAEGEHQFLTVEQAHIEARAEVAALRRTEAVPA